MRHAAPSARSATPVACSRSHGDLRPVSAAMAMKAASSLSPRSRASGTARSPRPVPTSASRRGRRGLVEVPEGELGETRLVRGARSSFDDVTRLARPGRGEEERDVPRHVEETHRRRDRVASCARESAPIAAREAMLERRLDTRPEVEPTREPLRDLAHRRERLTSPRGGVCDRVFEEGGADLQDLADADVGPVEREHLRRVGRVDEEERCPMRDVVAVELRRLVAVRGASRSVEQRDVVRVDELLRGRAGELSQTDREHGGAQGVLERLSGTEVGREREAPTTSAARIAPGSSAATWESYDRRTRNGHARVRSGGALSVSRLCGSDAFARASPHLRVGAPLRGRRRARSQCRWPAGCSGGRACARRGAPPRFARRSHAPPPHLRRGAGFRTRHRRSGQRHRACERRRGGSTAMRQSSSSPMRWPYVSLISLSPLQSSRTKLVGASAEDERDASRSSHARRFASPVGDRGEPASRRGPARRGGCHEEAPRRAAARPHRRGGVRATRQRRVNPRAAAADVCSRSSSPGSGRSMSSR